MKPINILIVESGNGYGGSSSYLYSFLKFVNRNRFKPVVAVYYESDGPNINNIRELGIKIIFLNKRESKFMQFMFSFLKHYVWLKFITIVFYKDIPNFIKFVIIIKKQNINLVLLNSEVHFNPAAVIAARFTNLPCVVRKSGVGDDDSKKLRIFLSKFVHHFIASSKAEECFHLQNRWPCHKISTVYEGVDISYFYPKAKSFNLHREIGILPDSLLVGYISRLDIGKGHDDFLKAARIVVNSLANVYFIIVGEDVRREEQSLKQSLLKLARDLGIDRKVFFLGWRTDVREILRDIDIFVHCPNTWKEGMGIATLEAIASGKPAVVTRNWGLAETVNDGFNGYVAAIGNHGEIAARIMKLLLDDTLRQVMSKSSRVFAEEYFNIAKNVIKIEDILSQEAKYQLKERNKKCIADSH